MKTIQFQDLVSTEFDIHDIIIINHAWRPDESYAIPSDGRPDNGLMFLSDIDIDYVTPDGRVFDRAKPDQSRRQTLLHFLLQNQNSAFPTVLG